MCVCVCAHARAFVCICVVACMHACVCVCVLYYICCVMLFAYSSYVCSHCGDHHAKGSCSERLSAVPQILSSTERGTRSHQETWSSGECLTPDET